MAQKVARKTGGPAAARSQTDTRRSKATGYVAAVLATTLIAGSLGALIGYNSGRPDATQNAIAEMREAEAKRDVQQITELTTLARTTADDLNKILAGLAEALPVEGTSDAPPAARERVEEWQRILRETAEKHAPTPSGATGTNVARGGLRSAVTALVTAVDTYAAGLRLPEGSRKDLLDLAARQRSTAVTMWSVAATQLDQLNVDAGNGHQHAYLTSTPGDGAITSDGVPEGHHDD
ncbi:hypothetical protein [Streptosporangium sp. NPDC000509]|uniref:hypothetical protein n=1 Tax=Streptosporangium sp. NPDC000509 TaxID=3366186 RepID=UPI00369F1AE3